MKETPVGGSAGGRLPHLLAPKAYFCRDHFTDEKQRLLEPAWHLAGTLADLKEHGDFVTLDLLGRAIQLRNFDGEVVALSNVCAHRHCLLREASRGSDRGLVCPYHGWEFGPDGRTRRIPSPKNFTPVDREADALPVYRLERCGQLLFICLDAKANSLEQQLGPLFALCEERFGPEWRATLSMEIDLEVNWKVPVENSLEAYHLAQVHPRTLGEDPGEERSVHEIGDGFTSFSTTHFSSKSRLDRILHGLEKAILRTLGRPHQGRYFHHHSYPHLLFSFTDALSLVQCILPTGPTRCRAVVRQFGVAGRSRNALGAVTKAWGMLGAFITRRILAEDRVLYPSIQRGLEASPHGGVLGYGERRIHAFQEHVLGELGRPTREGRVSL